MTGTLPHQARMYLAASGDMLKIDSIRQLLFFLGGGEVLQWPFKYPVSS